MLQISTLLPSHTVYGLGEHTGPLMRDTRYTSYIMWNNDMQPESNAPNAYGSHPFMMSLTQEGKAHGIAFHNSHAMEVSLQPTPAATFRALGGDFDISLVLGPTPVSVVEQYSSLTGKPFLVPYWSLGYHQCRFGYNSLNKTRAILEQTIDAGIPIDVQWNDIDYMDQFKDFTYDPVKFQGLPEFVDELHQRHMKYIQIVDPGISNSQPAGSYPPYDLGLQMNIFIRNSSDKPFVGKCWPRPIDSVVWPDFTHPRAVEYWHQNLETYHQKVPIDGVWIDMNDPSNMHSGSIYGGCAKDTDSHEDASLDNPPFVPSGIQGGKLYHNTICPSAKQFYGRHYEYHNVYGTAETVATALAMRKIRRKRAFVVSRSTSPGQGHYGAHWTGDVRSTWEDMKYSIPNIINMNMYGIPMVGADICGFDWNTTPELCSRWMQLGAFYPFSRNHNTDDAIDQDPVSLGPMVTESARIALNARYKLLPFFYTQMAKAHLHGTPPVRSLAMNYPQDVSARSIDRQFMWGQDLMVVPVLEKKSMYNLYLGWGEGYPEFSWDFAGDMRQAIQAYFPKDSWYDWWDTDRGNIAIQGPAFKKLAVTETVMPVFVRGGAILPTQRNQSTTYASRKTPFDLRVYFPKPTEQGMFAEGDLYLDDGDSLDTVETGSYSRVNFRANHSTKTGAGAMTAQTEISGYSSMPVGTIMLFGVPSKIHDVRINDVKVTFAQKSGGCVHVDTKGQVTDIVQGFTLKWN